MKIKIKNDALNIYVKDNTDWSGNYYGRDRWERFLKEVAGKELEVDKENLFKSEFDLLPIPGITKSKVRIMEDYVEEVIDDQRIGKARCELCNKVSQSIAECSYCGRTNYLDPF